MRVIEVTEQMGGAQFEDVVDLGVQTLSGALEIFDQKSWESESKVAESTGLCAPTISLTDRDSGSVYWVSPYLIGSALTFVNEYRYRIESPGFLSRMLRKTHKSPSTRELTFKEAREGIIQFMEGEHEKLLEHVRRT